MLLYIFFILFIVVQIISHFFEIVCQLNKGLEIIIDIVIIFNGGRKWTTQKFKNSAGT